ncbi:MAG: hypothetical protein V3S38_04940 [Acidimicrobiia bacterium]
MTKNTTRPFAPVGRRWKAPHSLSLTHGRDGFLVVIPPDARLDLTASILFRSGLVELAEEQATLDARMAG